MLSKRDYKTVCIPLRWRAIGKGHENDFGSSLQIVRQSLDHSPTLAKVAIHKEELKGFDLGSQRRDQPCSCRVVECKPSNGITGWRNKANSVAVIADFFVPLFSREFPCP